MCYQRDVKRYIAIPALGEQVVGIALNLTGNPHGIALFLLASGRGVSRSTEISTGAEMHGQWQPGCGQFKAGGKR